MGPAPFIMSSCEGLRGVPFSLETQTVRMFSTGLPRW